MNEIIRKLKTMQMSFESVEHNCKFRNDNAEAERFGTMMISQRFAENLGNIIKELETLNVGTSIAVSAD